MTGCSGLVGIFALSLFWIWVSFLFLSFSFFSEIWLWWWFDIANATLVESKILFEIKGVPFIHALEWLEAVKNNCNKSIIFLFRKTKREKKIIVKLSMQYFRGDCFLFGLIFIKKKIIKLKFKKKSKLVQTDQFRFGLDFWTKTGSTWFGLVFLVWLSGLAQFFDLTRFWLSFFRFGSVFSSFFCLGSVRFVFFVSSL